MSEIPETLLREGRGRQAFASLLNIWLKRSGWSYAVFADLAEIAVITMEARGIPHQKAGERCQKGDLRIFNGHIWIAKTDVVNGRLPRFREASRSDTWEHVCSVRRVVASQINKAVRKELIHATVSLFDTCGLLNKYIEGFQAGKYPGPNDAELRRRAAEGIVIQDEEGSFGAEEFFSVYVGNLKIPEMCEIITDQEAIDLSAQVAREIRQAITECGLDLIEDWPQFISAYPTSDASRHARIRDVALGLARWSAEQVRDEQAAVAIALSRLRTRHAQESKRSGPANRSQSS